MASGSRAYSPTRAPMFHVKHPSVEVSLSQFWSPVTQGLRRKAGLRGLVSVGPCGYPVWASVSPTSHSQCGTSRLDADSAARTSHWPERPIFSVAFLRGVLVAPTPFGAVRARQLRRTPTEFDRHLDILRPSVMRLSRVGGASLAQRLTRTWWDMSHGWWPRERRIPEARGVETIMGDRWSRLLDEDGLGRAGGGRD